jgi:two-component system response regulator YesN
MIFFDKRDQNREDLNNRVIDDIKEYINQNYMNEISLSELSERFSISYSHLSKLFHTFSGVTFRTYLLNYRLEKATQFLMESRDSVKEIAYNTGFRDTGYFIKQFKRHFGSTPSNFRKSEIVMIILDPMIPGSVLDGQAGFSPDQELSLCNDWKYHHVHRRPGRS